MIKRKSQVQTSGIQNFLKYNTNQQIICNLFSPLSLTCLTPSLRYFFLCPPLHGSYLFSSIILVFIAFSPFFPRPHFPFLPCTSASYCFLFFISLFLVIFLPSLFYYTHNSFLPCPLPFMTHKHVLAQNFAVTYRLKASATQGSLSQDSWTLPVHTSKTTIYILSHGLRS